MIQRSQNGTGIANGKEAGVVSLMVTMIMMIVISLIVLGFAEVSRTEQRSTVDAQLSTQAYYAAESGINDARSAINSMLASGGTLQPKTTCNNQNGYNFNPAMSQIDAAHNVSYTCVLISTAVSSLVYNIGYSSTVVPIISNGPAFGQLIFTWSSANGAPASTANCYNNISQLKQFPSAGGGAWTCGYPVVRVDLVDASTPLSRANWANSTATMFFVPFQSGGVAATRFNAGGSVIPVQCNNVPTADCSIRLTGMGRSKSYYARFTTLYLTNFKMTITTNGSTLFTGAEAQIDATGKAQDVLRRIVVAIDLTSNNVTPSDALVTEDSVCKRFDVTSSSVDVATDPFLNNHAGKDGNSLCDHQVYGTPGP